MSVLSRLAALAAVAGALAACADRGDVVDPSISALVAPASPSSSPLEPEVRISEFHYDNAGADADEKIVVSAPSGTNLSGYSVVLYNGSGGAAYATIPLSGTAPSGQAKCGPRGILSFPAVGMQNGSPDGMALVYGTTVIEFLSYEGTFTAVGGPANGQTSTDVGVAETGSETGTSIQRRPFGSDPAWVKGAAKVDECTDYAARLVSVTAAPATAAIGDAITLSAEEIEDGAPKPTTFTFASSDEAVVRIDDAASGAASAVGPGVAQITATAKDGTQGATTVTVLAPPPAVRLSELHYDNAGSDQDEQVEVEGPAGTDLGGWSLVLYNGNGGGVYGTIPLSGVITDLCDGRGVLAFPTPGLQNGAPDGLALVDGSGAVIEFLSYEGTMVATDGPAKDRTATDIGAAQSGGGPVTRSLARSRNGLSWAEATRSFGACNYRPAVAVTYSPTTVRVDDVVEFAAQLTDADGVPVPTTFSWSSSDAAVLLIDAATGTAMARAEGSATIRATAQDGTVGTALVTVLGAPKGTVDITIRGLNDLPVGFAHNIFVVTHQDKNGAALPWYEVTLESRDPSIATVDGFYATAVAPGDVWIIGRGADQGIDSTIVRVQPFTLEGPHQYRQSNVEFGTPTDSDPSDDLLIERQQYTLSYNATRGGPNWVSWVLNATHFNSAVERCDCFTGDPLVPTAARIGPGDFSGSGYQRGHMVMSEQRTSTLSENAATFYMTNMLPQAGANNGGPWLQFEFFANDLARDTGREVYNIAGGIYLPGAATIADGRVAVPSFTWKVVVVAPGGQGLENVDRYDDIEVYAIRTPNDLRPDVPGTVAGITNDWRDYETTVDALEAETGYDLLALLPDHIEILVESRTHPPTAVLQAPAYTIVGESITVDAGASSDPDGDALAFTWSFGDGATATGVQATHAYGSAGQFSIALVATDSRGVADTTHAVIAVDTRQQAVDSVSTRVDALVASGAINAGNGQSLNAKLAAARASLDRGNFNAASGQLGAALNQLDALEGAGRIPSADAATLRALIHRIVATLP